MIVLYSLLMGLMFGVGIYLLMSRNYIRVIVGLGLLGHGVNLLVFGCGGLVRGAAPLMNSIQNSLPHAGYADPLPQALVLTAIVIGFGAQVFLFVVSRETFSHTKKENIETLKEEVG
jgi:multicomponent Na+:H+ antiporter subunit C